MEIDELDVLDQLLFDCELSELADCDDGEDGLELELDKSSIE
jgi:hypothetical protein